MRKILVQLVMAAVMLTALPAWAGEKEKAAALELVKMVVPQDTYNQMIEQMTAAMSEQFRKAGDKLPADFDKKIQGAVHDVMSYDDVLSWTADIYAARFSVEELKEIEKFYRTPVGKKVMKLLPELSAEIGKKIATVLPERMPGALKKHGLMPDDAEGDAEPPKARKK